jgi:hypothetical protein
MNGFAARKTLPQELIRELFTYDDGKLLRLKPGPGITVGANAGFKFFNIKDNNFRWVIKYKGKIYKRSVLVWIYHHGDVPVDRLVDHHKGNTLDDRIENLRLATHQENAKNRVKSLSVKGKPTSSKYKGVSWHKYKKKWQAQIGVRRKGKEIKIFLGYFDTEEEAYAAYVAAAKLLHGEFFNPG